MKGAVWTVGGILALNILFVAMLWISLVVQRLRTARLQRHLEIAWQIPTLPTATRARRLRTKRLFHVALAATMVWATLAVVGIRADRVITSALGAVVPGGQAPSEGPEGGVAGPISGRNGTNGATTPLGAEVPSTSTGPTPTAGDLGAPSAIAATATSANAIRLAWTHVSNANGYEIDRSVDGERWIAVATTEPNVTTYTDAGLSAGTTYFYRVLTVTDQGTAPASDVVSATTAGGSLDAPVVTVTATSSTAIGISWTDVEGETGYRIERSTDGSTGWTTIATTGVDVTVSTDTGLLPGSTYSYRVFAIDADGESSPSDAASATTSQDTGPDTNGPAGADAAIATTDGSIATTDPSAAPQPDP